MMVLVIKRWWFITKRIFVFSIIVFIPTLALAVTETTNKSENVESFITNNFSGIIQAAGLVLCYIYMLLSSVKEIKNDVNNIKKETCDIREKLEDLQGAETKSQIRLKEQEIDIRYQKELMRKLEELIMRLDDETRNK